MKDKVAVVTGAAAGMGLAVAKAFARAGATAVLLDINEPAAQAEQILKNMKGALESQGLDFSDVVKTTVFIKDMNDFGAVNEVYGRRMAQPYPARSCVEVARLPKDALVEIEVVAKKC